MSNTPWCALAFPREEVRCPTPPGVPLPSQGKRSDVQHPLVCPGLPQGRGQMSNTPWCALAFPREEVRCPTPPGVPLPSPGTMAHFAQITRPVLKAKR
ncbi:hypothetical protein ACOMHN_046117 [Nucella lapillus]